MKRKNSVIIALAVLFMLSCSQPLFQSEMIQVKPEPTQGAANGSNLVLNFTVSTVVPLATSDKYRTVGSWNVRENPKAYSRVLAVATNEKVRVVRTVGSWYYVSLIVEDIQYLGWIHSKSRGEK